MSKACSARKMKYKRIILFEKLNVECFGKIKSTSSSGRIINCRRLFCTNNKMSTTCSGRKIRSHGLLLSEKLMSTASSV